MKLFSEEIEKEVPSQRAAPTLDEHVSDICNMKFKKIDLVQGWHDSSKVPGKRVDWIMRDVRDSGNDL